MQTQPKNRTFGTQTEVGRLEMAVLMEESIDDFEARENNNMSLTSTSRTLSNK